MRSLVQIHENDNPPILILGGGFAGLFAALHLRDLHSCPKYPTLTLPDILGSHCIAGVEKFVASGVREPDFTVSPQYIGGIKGGN